MCLYKVSCKFDLRIGFGITCIIIWEQVELTDLISPHGLTCCFFVYLFVLVLPNEKRKIKHTFWNCGYKINHIPENRVVDFLLYFLEHRLTI